MALPTCLQVAEQDTTVYFESNDDEHFEWRNMVLLACLQAAEQGAASEPESDDDQFDPEAVTRVKMPWFGTPLGYATVPRPGNVSGDKLCLGNEQVTGVGLVTHGHGFAVAVLACAPAPLGPLHGVMLVGTESSSNNSNQGGFARGKDCILLCSMLNT
eukprot:scaffold46108_cov21-Tisochrysis_lutea.AAC.7